MKRYIIGITGASSSGKSKIEVMGSKIKAI